MVIGTTGHDEAARARICDAARRIPIVMAANFSVGVDVLRRALGDVVRRLGADFDIEIVETHHRLKVDAPSGTALLLAREIEQARSRAAGRNVKFVHGREGAAGPRKADEVGIHAVRMGEIVGQHEVYLSGPGETIMLKHTAHSRDTFAAGALRAAAWIVGKPVGEYSLSDVLG
jgi:4-hydroxy-tetrahydrodipicolinate reductase